MNTFKLFVPIIAVVILVSMLAGFLYLQSEITGLRNPSSAQSTPTSTAVINPTPTPTTTINPTTTPTPSPNYVTSSTENSTTATYAGTTLVCTWSSGTNVPNGDPNGVIIGNDSSSTIYVDSINITNIGEVTAYVSGIRVQTYSSNGTLVMDSTITLDASGLYTAAQPGLPRPYQVSPDATIGVGFNARATSQFFNNLGSNAFATYTITPVWSSTGS